MPEYFVTSFIINDKHQKATIKQYILTNLNLPEGHTLVTAHKFEILQNKEVVFYVLEYEAADFDEFCIAIADQIFSKQFFNEEIQQLTDLVEFCFKASSHIMFALCSYEINGYLLSSITKIAEINTDFLLKFPIAYAKQADSSLALSINLEAQDIFTLYPIQFDR